MQETRCGHVGYDPWSTKQKEFVPARVNLEVSIDIWGFTCSSLVWYQQDFLPLPFSTSLLAAPPLVLIPDSAQKNTRDIQGEPRMLH